MAAPPRLLHLPPRLRSPFALAHGIVLLLGFLFFLRINRHQWFFGDDWDFITIERRERPWLEQYLGPHNEHWVTIPLLLFRLTEWLFGLEQYLVFLLPVIAVHLALSHLLWRLMLRTGTAPEIALAASTLFVFLPSAWENLLWAFQIGFVGSILCGVAAILLLDHHGRWNRRDWGALAILVVSLAFSGLSVAMVVAAALMQALRRGVLAAAALAALPAAVYLAWWATFYDVSLYAARSVGEYLDGVSEFVGLGLAAAVEQTLGYASAYSAGSGFVLVLVLFAILVRHAAHLRGSATVVLVCLAGAVVLLALLAYGRAQLGPGQAAAPRYVYGVTALLLPSVALALTWLVARSRAAAWIVAGALFLLAAQGVLNLRELAGTQAEREHSVQRVLAAASDLLEAGVEADPRLQPEPMQTEHVTVRDLRRFRARGLLVSVDYDEADRLTAETNLLVSLSDTPPREAEAQERACRAARGEERRVAPATEPTSYRIEAPEGSALHVRLADPANEIEGRGRDVVAPAGRSYLTVLAPERSLAVTFADDRDVVFCG